MKKSIFVFIYSIILIFSVTQLAQALPYTFDMGGGSSVDTSGTNDVLQMYASVDPNLDSVIFSLNEGQSSGYFKFATLGTTESWINKDDLYPGQVTANVDFDNPDLFQAVGGTSVGFQGSFSFTQGWNLIWDDPVYVTTSDGLKFSIDLTDVSYYSWFWQGPDGSANVYAKITLLSDPNGNPSSVPDADIMWLLGPAFIALGVMGRKKSRSGFKTSPRT